ncbi:uncharacterized protein LOC122026654 [Zingiber officinale]|uniref:uncharacterized protein LOC122026654 n=1 Tax=Zingiber officinale TaxID=94328 RepID=UPI001C4D4AFA|nr:uncharacterized protein LOC122026654 [Zingiber officinale]
MAQCQRRFLLVAVDYFSKWVEAEALTRITEDVVIQFLWRNILCRFGIPHKLVSDNGRQFQGKKIQAWCKGFGITQAFTSVAYPQSNGQTEVVNREIVRGLTPFHLVYDNEAVVPIEIGVPSVRRTLYDEGNTERQLAKLDLISETRDRTTARLEAYRQRMRQNYNRRVFPRFFGEGDLAMAVGKAQQRSWKAQQPTQEELREAQEMAPAVR